MYGCVCTTHDVEYKFSYFWPAVTSYIDLDKHPVGLLGCVVACVFFLFYDGRNREKGEKKRRVYKTDGTGET